MLVCVGALFFCFCCYNLDLCIFSYLTQKLLVFFLNESIKSEIGYNAGFVGGYMMIFFLFSMCMLVQLRRQFRSSLIGCEMENKSFLITEMLDVHVSPC